MTLIAAGFQFRAMPIVLATKKRKVVRKIGFSLSGALLAAMVLFVSTMDLYDYFNYGQVWIRHRGLEPAADHPLALWIKFVFDGACLTVVIFAIVAGISGGRNALGKTGAAVLGEPFLDRFAMGIL